MAPPLFTPRSARDAALSLRPTLADALRLHRALRAHAPAPGAEERPVDPTYFAGVTRLVRALEAVRAAGAEIDLGRGRLRFPARREGRDVVLWWELAEPHALWHEAWEEGWEEPR